MMKKLFVKQSRIITHIDNGVRYTVVKTVNIIPNGMLEIGHVLTTKELEHYLAHCEWEVEVS